MSACGCLSIHTERRRVHTTVYTRQCVPITLIKFHTTQGDRLRPDQIANISWLKYMFAKRLEWKNQHREIHKLMAGSEDAERNIWNTMTVTVCLYRHEFVPVFEGNVNNFCFDLILEKYFLMKFVMFWGLRFPWPPSPAVLKMVPNWTFVVEANNWNTDLLLVQAACYRCSLCDITVFL